MGLLEWYFNFVIHFTACLSDPKNIINSYQHNRLYAMFLMTPVQQENQPYTAVLPNLKGKVNTVKWIQST